MHAGPDEIVATAISEPRRVARARGIALFLGYLVLQALTIVGLTTPRFPDSSSYLQLSFTGNDPRLWVVPLFYRVLHVDSLRITGQVVLAVVAWWVLAGTAGALMTDRRVRTGVRVVLLVLGLCGPIVSWNSTILSESVSISLTALVIASWLWLFGAPSPRRAALAFVATGLWAFTRPDQAVTAALIAVVLLVTVIRRGHRAVKAGLAITLVVVSGLAVYTAGRNPDVRVENLAGIFADKILPVPSRTAWFIDHGMPYDPTVAAAAGVYPPTSLVGDPEFNTWLVDDATHAYLTFVLEHPGYTLLGPLPYLSGEKSSLFVPNPPPSSPQVYPVASMLSPTANYGRHRDVVPSVIEDLLFEQGQIGDVMALTILALGVNLAAWRRWGRDGRLVIPACTVVLVFIHDYGVWLTSGPPELDRQSMTQAVALRIALWVAVACGVDRLLVPRDRHGRHARVDRRVRPDAPAP